MLCKQQKIDSFMCVRACVRVHVRMRACEAYICAYLFTYILLLKYIYI